MADAKNISPLLDDFSLGSPYSAHSGITCCPAIHTVTNEKFILKGISIPESQVQVDAMLLTGACQDRAAAQSYYEEIAKAMEQEVELLDRLAQSRGFAPFTGHQLVPKEDGQVGMDLWVLSPYKTTLAAYARRSPLTHLNAVNLGIDLCAALALCRQAGFLYQDLKPENIFITQQRHFQLGDFGFLPLEELTYATFPDKYRSPYTAPELFDDFAELNATVDIYALGMVLYQVYNGGQGPFAESGDLAEKRRLEGETFPAPAYADYEMAEIIQKAVAFRPQDRWQSPEEMGSALIAYMQRNPVNDAVIAPPIITDPVFDAAAQAIDEKAAQQAAAQSPESEEAPEAAPEFSEPQPPEEPQPESPEPELPEEPQPETPEPPFPEEPEAEIPEAEAPEPELPEPETPEPEASEPEIPEASEPEEEDPLERLLHAQLSEPEDGGTDAPIRDQELADILSRVDALLSTEPVPPAPTDPSEDAVQEYAGTEDTDEDEEYAPEKKRSFRGLIAFLAIVLVLAVAAVGGYYYYTDIYCIPVERMEVVDGALDTLTISLTTQADPSQVRLSCQDTYGNAYTAQLVDGKATFTGLNPNTQYTVTASAEGFHKLIGQTQVRYTTGVQTEIVSFTALAGSEDGSVILSFTPNGTEPETWSIAWSAEGEETLTRQFTGHNVTITGLTVGKEYTFTLDAGSDIFLTGSNPLTYTACAVITAQNLAISDYTSDSLTLTWDEPETPVESWTVRCYDSGDFNATVTVTECTATIEGISPDASYTLEVTAAGMTQNAWMAITANPVNVTECTADTETPGLLTLSWTYTGTDPEGWVVLYSYREDQETMEVIQTDEPTVTIAPALPGTGYRFMIQSANGSTVLNGNFLSVTPEASAFDAYGVSAANVFMATFPAPDDPDWATKDVTPDNQTSRFSVNDRIAFVLEITDDYDGSDSNVTTLIVIRDAGGVPVDYTYGTTPWSDMWTNDKYLGELKQTPQTPGDYQLEIYFNGQLVRTTEITITE